MTWEAGKWDARARVFPTAVGLVAIVAGGLQVAFATRVLMRGAGFTAPQLGTEGSGLSASGRVVAEAVDQAFGPGSLAEQEADLPEAIVRRRTTLMVLWILGITAGVVVFGFELGSALATVAFLHFGARERLRVSVGIGVATYLFFYVLFDRGLHVPLPAGALADALGLRPLDHYLVDPVAQFIERVLPG